MAVQTVEFLKVFNNKQESNAQKGDIKVHPEMEEVQRLMSPQN